MARLTHSDALAAFRSAGVDPTKDFFTLNAFEVEALIVQADKAKYRKPRNANGSRGRYWHAYLQRAVSKESNA